MLQTVPGAEPPLISAKNRAEILETLEKITESPHFRKSRRYPALLKYSVHHTMAGDFDLLKERVIGSEVFGRPADYDTNDDPVVRITAGEVRKRLVQYYADHGDAPVRIDLPSGSYVAELHVKEETLQECAAVLAVVDVPASADPAPLLPVSSLEDIPLPPVGRSSSFPMRLLLLSAVVLFAAGCAGVWSHVRAERRSDFWRPLLQGDQQPLILVGLRSSSAEKDDAVPWQPPASSSSPKYRVVMANTIAAAYICGVLARSGKECRLIEAPTVSFSDIRNKSLMLVGSFDNPWTERLLAPLRFHFYREDGTDTTQPRYRYIVDQNGSASRSPWAVDARVPSTQRTSDYSLIARFRSDVTDNSVVVAAGIGTYGTRTAAEYIVSKPRMGEILAMAPRQWPGFNFEVVLQTDIVEGHAGHSKIVATHFW